MNDRKKLDLLKGEESENRLFNKIKIAFDTNLKKSTDKYARFDFYSNKTKVELKSRNNTKDRYPTTMIGYNKVAECRNNPHIDYYFVFDFTDGTYYWKYNDEFFDFQLSNGGRWDRGKIETNLYLFIPVDKLTQF